MWLGWIKPMFNAEKQKLNKKKKNLFYFLQFHHSAVVNSFWKTSRLDEEIRIMRSFSSGERKRGLY